MEVKECQFPAEILKGIVYFHSLPYLFTFCTSAINHEKKMPQVAAGPRMKKNVEQTGTQVESWGGAQLNYS